MTSNIKIGLYQRLRDIFGSDFKKVKPKDHKRGIAGTRMCSWSGDETPMCLSDAMVFITGSAFCAEHATEIVGRYEEDGVNRLSKLRDELLAIGLTNIEPTPGQRCTGVLASNCCQTAVVMAGGLDYCLEHGEFVLRRHHNAMQSVQKT